MSGKLFTKGELTKEEIIKKVRWSQALEACEELHKELLHCKKTSFISTCHKENQKFWDCFQAIAHPEKKAQHDQEEASL